jgi:hypothetical protein
MTNFIIGFAVGGGVTAALVVVAYLLACYVLAQVGTTWERML